MNSLGSPQPGFRLMRLAFTMTATAHISSRLSDRFATEPYDALTRLDHHTRAQAIAPEDAGPGSYLEVEGPDGPRLLALHDPMVYVGRSFTSGLRIDDHSVSRRHAILVRRARRTRVLDDRSLNGTFVNGRRVEEAELADGDVITLGSVVLVFRELD
jgi:pSer/pThr/pTyr-binding forkhead associated (FHA) protein